MSAVRRIYGLPPHYGLPSPPARTPSSILRAQPPASGIRTPPGPVSWTAPNEIKKPVQAFC